jgi:hypothetical protein
MAGTSSETVTYVRGVTSENVTAVIGSFVFRIVEMYGAVTRVHSRDFLIKKDEINSTFGPPRAGDEIKETGGDGVTRIYRVAAPAGEDEWSWSDEYQNTYRIHTKYIRTTSI